MRDKQIDIWLIIFAVVVIALLWACAGCGTMTGLVDDSCDLLNHARTHVK